MFMRRVSLAIFVCAFLASGAQTASHKHANLKKQVEKILEQPDLGRGYWGLEITSVTKRKVLCSINADKILTPASTTNLFTTAAALALLGPASKFRTTAES